MTKRLKDVTVATAPTPRNCQQCSVESACPITRSRCDQVAKLPVTEHGFRVGCELQAQGSTSTAIRIVKSGATVLYRESRSGGRQPIGMLGRGTMIGSFALLGRVNPVTHIGLLEGRYCELSHAELGHSGLLEDPVFLGHLSETMAHVVESHFNWCQLRNGVGVTSQLAGALLHLSDMQRSVRVRLPNQTTIAALLSTTRESITRAFAKLQKEGNVRRCGRHYCDLNVPGLQQHIQAPDALPRQ